MIGVSPPFAAHRTLSILSMPLTKPMQANHHARAYVEVYTRHGYNSIATNASIIPMHASQHTPANATAIPLRAHHNYTPANTTANPMHACQNTPANTTAKPMHASHYTPANTTAKPMHASHYTPANATANLLRSHHNHTPANVAANPMHASHYTPANATANLLRSHHNHTPANVAANPMHASHYTPANATAIPLRAHHNYTPANTTANPMHACQHTPANATANLLRSHHNHTPANVAANPMHASHYTPANATAIPLRARYRADPGSGRDRSRLAGRRHRGLTLLEVMVALFILSIMTLGTFAMQEITLTSSINIDHHTAAERLAEELSNFYSVYTTRNAGGGVLGNFIFDDAQNPFAGVCGPANIVDPAPGNVNDTLSNFLACWRFRVSNTLPAGRSTVTFVGDPATSTVINIRILWGPGNARNTVNIIAG